MCCPFTLFSVKQQQSGLMTEVAVLSALLGNRAFSVRVGRGRNNDRPSAQATRSWFYVTHIRNRARPSQSLPATFGQRPFLLLNGRRRLAGRGMPLTKMYFFYFKVSHSCHNAFSGFASHWAYLAARIGSAEARLLFHLARSLAPGYYDCD